MLALVSGWFVRLGMLCQVMPFGLRLRWFVLGRNGVRPGVLLSLTRTALVVPLVLWVAVPVAVGMLLRPSALALALAAVPVAIPARLVLRIRRTLELAERLAERLDLPLVGALLNLHVIERFQHLLHVAQHVIELFDNSQHFLRGLLDRL